MKNFPMLLILGCMSVMSTGVYAQPYPKDYFRSPMDITIRLSGNFGELRPNHFHAGIDITTQGVEGLPVRAAAEGYVSRIKISPWGYGKAIYITHPNGYTTVYGHLSEYTGAIAEWVKKQQYFAESFEVELFPQAGELPVTKGQQVGASGNTGSSGGPHLHFEIRDSKTEEALNPLLFGLPVQDAVDPTPVTLAVYAVGENSYVNGKGTMKKIALVRSGTKYVIQNAGDSIVAFGEIGFGIEAYDKETLAQGKNGVYGIELREGKNTIYKHHLDRIPFEDSRYINCFVDYAEHERSTKYFQLSYLVPNNELPVYDTVVNHGYVTHSDGKFHYFTYIITDVYGNSSTVEFKTKALTKAPKIQSAAVEIGPFVQVLVWDKPNKIEEQEFTFETPEKSIYKNTVFKWSGTKATGARVSPSITINDKFTPLHKACTLTIHMAETTPDTGKLVMVRVKEKGGLSNAGATWNGRGMTALIKDFGTYYVMRDTVPPTVRALNFDKGKAPTTSFAGMSSIQLKIGDNLSGIQTYRGTIDDKWVLFEYEPKKDQLKYTFDDSVGKGKHTLAMVVKDKCGNETRYVKEFTR